MMHVMMVLRVLSGSLSIIASVLTIILRVMELMRKQRQE